MHGKTAAMEVSSLDAVPYLDRVPWGVVELLKSLGANGHLERGAGHPIREPLERGGNPGATCSAAEQLAAIGRAEVARAAAEGGQWHHRDAGPEASDRRDPRRGAGLRSSARSSASARAPRIRTTSRSPGRDRTLAKDEAVLIDLWGGSALGTVFADQTWMGFSGRNPPERMRKAWDAVRRRSRCRGGAGDGGGARPAWRCADSRWTGRRAAVIDAAGFGAQFIHRTGHSIDRDLHGSGPNMDDYEIHDERVLMPGVGFSVEPGIYFAGEFGLEARSTCTGGHPALSLLRPSHRWI